MEVCDRQGAQKTFSMTDRGQGTAASRPAVCRATGSGGHGRYRELGMTASSPATDWDAVTFLMSQRCHAMSRNEAGGGGDEGTQ